MSKNSSGNQNKYKKKNGKEKLAENIKVFPKKKKKKSDNIVMNDTKIYKKMKNKNLLSIEKILKIDKKTFIIIKRKYYFKK